MRDHHSGNFEVQDYTLWVEIQRGLVMLEGFNVCRSFLLALSGYMVRESKDGFRSKSLLDAR